MFDRLRMDELAPRQRPDSADDVGLGRAVHVHFQQSAFTFSPPLVLAVGGIPNVVRTLDVNNDGLVDIVTGNVGSTVSVRLNTLP